MGTSCMHPIRKMHWSHNTRELAPCAFLYLLRKPTLLVYLPLTLLSDEPKPIDCIFERNKAAKCQRLCAAKIGNARTSAEERLELVSPEKSLAQKSRSEVALAYAWLRKCSCDGDRADVRHYFNVRKIAANQVVPQGGTQQTLLIVEIDPTTATSRIQCGHEGRLARRNYERSTTNTIPIRTNLPFPNRKARKARAIFFCSKFLPPLCHLLVLPPTKFLAKTPPLNFGRLRATLKWCLWNPQPRLQNR